MCMGTLNLTRSATDRLVTHQPAQEVNGNLAAHQPQCIRPGPDSLPITREGLISGGEQPPQFGARVLRAHECLPDEKGLDPVTAQPGHVLGGQDAALGHQQPPFRNPVEEPDGARARFRPFFARFA